MAVSTPTRLPLAPPTASRPWGRQVARLAKLALGAAAWAVFLFFAVFAALGLFWVALPIVMLGSAPAGWCGLSPR